jgi:hypothetical protein
MPASIAPSLDIQSATCELAALPNAASKAPSGLGHVARMRNPIFPATEDSPLTMLSAWYLWIKKALSPLQDKVYDSGRDYGKRVAFDFSRSFLTQTVAQGAIQIRPAKNHCIVKALQ